MCWQRLENVPRTAYYPLIEDEFVMMSSSDGVVTSESSGSLQWRSSELPLVIRERDVEYQFSRLVLYERLLRAYPYTRTRLWREARVDVPPLYRAPAWAALLDVEVTRRRPTAEHAVVLFCFCEAHKWPTCQPLLTFTPLKSLRP